MSILCKAFQSVVPSDAPDVTPNAIKEALVAAERNRVVRVKEETRVARVECVRLLLVRLEWLRDGEPINNDVLRRFRIPQDPSKFVAHEWPMGIHNRISFLYEHRNENWRGKSWLTEPLSGAKRK
jgi:hypothetical protein